MRILLYDWMDDVLLKELGTNRMALQRFCLLNIGFCMRPNGLEVPILCCKHV